MNLEIELSQFCLKNDKQKINAQKGRLTSYKQRSVRMCYKCKFRLEKNYSENLVPGKKVTKTLQLPGMFS